VAETKENRGRKTQYKTFFSASLSGTKGTAQMSLYWHGFGQAVHEVSIAQFKPLKYAFTHATAQKQTISPQNGDPQVSGGGMC